MKIEPASKILKQQTKYVFFLNRNVGNPQNDNFISFSCDFSVVLTVTTQEYYSYTKQTDCIDLSTSS